MIWRWEKQRCSRMFEPVGLGVYVHVAKISVNNLPKSVNVVFGVAEVSVSIGYAELAVTVNS